VKQGQPALKSPVQGLQRRQSVAASPRKGCRPRDRKLKRQHGPRAREPASSRARAQQRPRRLTLSPNFDASDIDCAAVQCAVCEKMITGGKWFARLKQGEYVVALCCPLCTETFESTTLPAAHRNLFHLPSTTPGRPAAADVSQFPRSGPLRVAVKPCNHRFRQPGIHVRERQSGRRMRGP